MVLRGVGGFKGVFGEVWGDPEGVCYTPIKALFAPLEVLYGTRFCSKHHIIVQPANVYRIDITGPFLNL